MLSIKDLDLYYGDAQALDRVSLEVPAGEIVAIIGANGAGKSSLIRSIAGIEKPRCGKIYFKKKEIQHLASHSICNLGIGQVAEGRQVFPTLSVEENLEMGGLLHEKGMTVLLVEQNVAVSLKISNHAYVLENGSIVMSGRGSERKSFFMPHAP